MMRRPYRERHSWSICLFCLLILLLTGTAGADTKKIEGTTNVEDTYIFSGGGSTTNNYGGSIYFSIDQNMEYRGLMRVKNVASELGVGATITACVCSLYCRANTTDGIISAYRVFKPWVEGTQDGGKDPPGATWADWDNDDWEWGTSGCDNASDAGGDNSGDGSDYDRKATAEDTENVTTINTWYAWDISTTLAQGWYDGTINEEGVIFIDAEVGGNNGFWSSEYTTDPTKCPFFTFTYTTGEPPEAGQVIIIGARDEENCHNPRLGIPSAMWE